MIHNNKLLIIDPNILEGLVKDVHELKTLVQEKDRKGAVLDLLRTEEVKRLLKLKDSSLATLRANGTIPFSKVGGTIYYLRKDIESIIKQNYSGNHDAL
ncbi:DNA-binding protein [Cyclobacteriaceae bacterium YHN15]|nr:DNA-binding protein [Cyclobacteriaceae bacterium YHN15]